MATERIFLGWSPHDDGLIHRIGGHRHRVHGHDRKVFLWRVVTRVITKETWAFITWVVYAGYLHARVTVGWKGRKTAVVALVGYASLIFNFIGVNIWLPGLHSYSGL